MNRHRIITELTRSITAPRFAASLVAAAGVSIAAPAVAQDYEWEADEGVHQEEWHDPSDWFMNDQYVNDESDWIGEDDWFEYDNYAYDPYYYDDTDSYYYKDSDPQYVEDEFYDRPAYAESDEDLYHDGPIGYELETNDFDEYTPDDDLYRTHTLYDGVQDDAYDSVNVYGEEYNHDYVTADRAEDRGRKAELRGEIEDWRRADIQGQRDAHTIVRLRLENGRRALVNLGPNVELARLNLDEGDRVAVYGSRGSIDGRSALMAEKVHVSGNTIRMDNWERARQDGQRDHRMTRRDREDQTRRDMQRPTERRRDAREGHRQRRDIHAEDRQRRDMRRPDHRMARDQYRDDRRRDHRQARADDHRRGMHPDAKRVRRIIDRWPSASRDAAETALRNHGKPDIISREALAWNNTGPFVRTVVFARPVDHNFPRPHKDVIANFVNFEVPADRMDELARFSGSIIAYRTDGLLAARGESEAMNTLALNLAADIAEDRISVDEARRRYAETAQRYAQGENPRLTRTLTFNARGRNLDRPDAPGDRYNAGRERAQAR